MDPRLEMRTATSHVPLAVLQQLFRLLPLSTTELHDAVDRALADNPVLARTAGTPCPGCGRHLRGRRCPTCAAAPVIAVEHATAEDWRAELTEAVRLEVSPELRDMVEIVIGAIDDHGFLEEDPDSDLFARAGVRSVLDAVMRIGPPGIAAAGPIDCVIRQCRSLVVSGDAPALLATIAEHHLEQVANNEFAVIARAQDVTVEAVREVVEILRHRTRPFVALGGSSLRTAAPDVFISFAAAHDDPLDVHVPDSSWYGLRLMRIPTNLEARQWSAPHRRRAEELIRQIDARASLLHRIATVIAEQQRMFLLNGGGSGTASHRTLRRADVAALLGVHPSTVGRAVNGKWLRCPDGRVLALSACFGAGTAPRELLRATMLAHPRATDKELEQVLALAGLRIARRTVAKYRLELGVRARGTKPGSPQPR